MATNPTRTLQVSGGRSPRGRARSGRLIDQFGQPAPTDPINTPGSNALSNGGHDWSAFDSHFGSPGASRDGFVASPVRTAPMPGTGTPRPAIAGMGAPALRTGGLTTGGLASPAAPRSVIPAVNPMGPAAPLAVAGAAAAINSQRKPVTAPVPRVVSNGVANPPPRTDGGGVPRGTRAEGAIAASQSPFTPSGPQTRFNVPAPLTSPSGNRETDRAAVAANRVLYAPGNTARMTQQPIAPDSANPFMPTRGQPNPDNNGPGYTVRTSPTEAAAIGIQHGDATGGTVTFRKDGQGYAGDGTGAPEKRSPMASNGAGGNALVPGASSAVATAPVGAAAAPMVDPMMRPAPAAGRNVVAPTAQAINTAAAPVVSPAGQVVNAADPAAAGQLPIGQQISTMASRVTGPDMRPVAQRDADTAAQLAESRRTAPVGGGERTSGFGDAIVKGNLSEAGTHLARNFGAGVSGVADGLADAFDHGAGAGSPIVNSLRSAGSAVQTTPAVPQNVFDTYAQKQRAKNAIVTR